MSDLQQKKHCMQESDSSEETNVEEKKIGRPTLYNEEVAKYICDEIAQGRTLTSILKEKGMPKKTAVHEWFFKNQEFADGYARARRLQLDTLTDSCLDLADETESSSIMAVHNKRLKIDTRKWYVTKVSPKIPFLKGALKTQIKELKESYAKGEINETVAAMMLNMMQMEANFVPIEDFREALAQLQEDIKQLKET